MAEIVDFVADALFFAWLLHDDGDGVVGVPKFVGPKMTWQQGEHHLSFGLGRVSIDGVDKIYSVFWPKWARSGSERLPSTQARRRQHPKTTR